MALATENANLVRQKAYTFANSGGTAAGSAHGEIWRQLKAFFLHLAVNKGNPDLQYIPFNATQVTTAAGYNPDIDACTLYAVYLRGRRTSGTTAAFFSVHDAADDAATTTTVWTFKFNVTGQEYFCSSPDGHVITTDITLGTATTVGGTTDSSAADACDGFIIVGA